MFAWPSIILSITDTRHRKPRNQRTARILKARTEPQLIEDRKRVLLLHGTKCPPPLHTVLKTIASLTKPHSVLLHKKNENIHPFENTESLEFLAGKNDAGVVVFASSSKKRPNAITICRTFDGKTLDMAELLLLGGEGQEEQQKMQIGVEMKPLILFAGNVWDDSSASDLASKFRMTKSLLLDIFQGEEIKTIDVEGLQYLMMVAASEPATSLDDPVIHVRWYKVRTRKSGHPKLPRVEVDEVGPRFFDFKIGRIKEADPDMWKEAMKKGVRPNEAGKKRKNIDMDEMGDKVGRVHLGKQDLSGLQTRKMKGLKGGREDVLAEDGEADEDMLEEDDDIPGFEDEGDDFDDDDEEGEDGVELIDEDGSVDGGMDVDGDEEDERGPKKARIR